MYFLVLLIFLIILLEDFLIIVFPSSLLSLKKRVLKTNDVFGTAFFILERMVKKHDYWNAIN